MWVISNLFLVCESSQLSDFSLKLSKTGIKSEALDLVDNKDRWEINNSHFHHIGQIKSLSSNCSPFYEETQMAEAHFNLSLLLAILAFSHLPRKSLRNVVDLRDEVPLTLRISWVLKLSSSCPATNMQRHCRRVFWVGRVTPNCPFLNHLQPFLQHNVPPSLIFDELLIHWQLHTVDPISVFFAAPPYHWATPHHTSCTQN